MAQSLLTVLAVWTACIEYLCDIVGLRFEERAVGDNCRQDRRCIPLPSLYTRTRTHHTCPAHPRTRAPCRASPQTCGSARRGPTCAPGHAGRCAGGSFWRRGASDPRRRRSPALQGMHRWQASRRRQQERPPALLLPRALFRALPMAAAKMTRLLPPRLPAPPATVRPVAARRGWRRSPGQTRGGMGHTGGLSRQRRRRGRRTMSTGTLSRAAGCQGRRTRTCATSACWCSRVRYFNKLKCVGSWVCLPGQSPMQSRVEGRLHGLMSCRHLQTNPCTRHKHAQKTRRPRSAPCWPQLALCPLNPQPLKSTNPPPLYPQPDLQM